MSFYTDLQATATRLLIDKGQLITYVQRASSAYDPETGQMTNTDTSYTGIPAAVVSFKNAEIDGTMVLKSDRKVLMGAGVVTPETTGLLQIGGATYAIVDVEAITPAGTDVIYKLQARRI